MASLISRLERTMLSRQLRWGPQPRKFHLANTEYLNKITIIKILLNPFVFAIGAVKAKGSTYFLC